MNKTISLLIFGLIAAPIANAQTTTTSASSVSATNSSTAKTDDLREVKEKEKDIDHEITDARMRADLGSKSRWSIKSNLAYNGASIASPFDAVRPNYRLSASGGEAMTYLAGNIGVNLRVTAKDSISFGTGVTINDPLHGDITKNANDSTNTGGNREMPRYEVSTPYLGWSRGYRLFNTQMSSSLSYSHYTDKQTVDQYKISGGLGFSQVFLADFGKSGWTGGTSVSLSTSFYSGEIEEPVLLARYNAGIYKRTELSYGLFPFLQYAFNDRYSFRTVFGYFDFRRYKNIDDNVQVEPYQSVGIGVSITRDIYLYPNVQFTPKDIRGDRTNVALSTNINLF